MESVVKAIEEAFRGRRVLVTGHTGFKGSWLTLWLHSLGAEVTGYALEAEPGSMFRSLRLETCCRSITADVRDLNRLADAIDSARPDYVFHLAAQALVLASYRDPLTTITTNVDGTANVLEVLRRLGRSCTVVVVTSDKCYENKEWEWAYRESDRLGGHDVYSMSKAAAELVVSSYRRSFFADAVPVRLASARAGNVIGGGDWAENRLVPDCVRALAAGSPITVRNPGSIRPWQHVMEPVSGYLLLASRMESDPQAYCEAWNFGPVVEDSLSVEAVVSRVVAAWGGGTWIAQAQSGPHEARGLRLAIDKAVARLGWRPRWSADRAIAEAVRWYRSAGGGADSDTMRELTLSQIRDFSRKDPHGSGG